MATHYETINGTWGPHEGFDQDDEEDIRALLLGHTVTKVADDKLQLDDGTVYTIIPNDGGCSCGAGDYELTELNECPNNAIMAVEFEFDEEGEYNFVTGEGASPQRYRIFVLAEDRRIKLMEVEGSDGNGYYGTGYWIGILPAA